MAIVNNLIVNGSSSITGNLGVKNKISSNSITMSGTLYLANNTWNNIGDDAAFGDINTVGCVGFKGLNSTSTGIILLNKDDSTKRTTLTSDAYGNFTITPTAATYIRGTNMELSASEDIVIESANDSITITAPDDNIDINANATLALYGDNEIIISGGDIHLNTNNNIHVKFGSASSITLENYIKQVFNAEIQQILNNNY